MQERVRKLVEDGQLEFVYVSSNHILYICVQIFETVSSICYGIL